MYHFRLVSFAHPHSFDQSIWELRIWNKLEISQDVAFPVFTILKLWKFSNLLIAMDRFFRRNFEIVLRQPENMSAMYTRVLIFSLTHP